MKTTVLMTRENAKTWTETYVNEYTAVEILDLFTAEQRAALEAGERVVRDSGCGTTLTTVSLNALGDAALAK